MRIADNGAVGTDHKQVTAIHRYVLTDGRQAGVDSVIQILIRQASESSQDTGHDPQKIQDLYRFLLRHLSFWRAVHATPPVRTFTSSILEGMAFYCFACAMSAWACIGLQIEATRTAIDRRPEPIPIVQPAPIPVESLNHRFEAFGSGVDGAYDEGRDDAGIAAGGRPYDSSSTSRKSRMQPLPITPLSAVSPYSLARSIKAGGRLRRTLAASLLR